MDTASLAGSLESKLAAIRHAGFSQVMISAGDVVGHPAGVAGGARVVRDSGLKVTGLEALRDFEGLAGRLHDYKVDVAKAMLEVCAALGGRLLLVEASTSTHADASADATIRDLRMLAMLAIPIGIRIAFKGVSWSRTVTDFAAAGDIVFRANCPNLGLAVDAFDVLAARIPLNELEAIDPRSRSISSSCPTTCGSRSARSRRKRRPRPTSACFRAKARTATISPGSSARSTESATAAITASTSTTTTTSRCRRRPGRPARASRRRVARRNGAAARAAGAQHGAPRAYCPVVDRASGRRGGRRCRARRGGFHPDMKMQYRRLGDSGLEGFADLPRHDDVRRSAPARPTPGGSSTPRSMPASISSTPPTRTGTAPPRRSSAPRSSRPPALDPRHQGRQSDDFEAARRRAVAALDHAGLRRQPCASRDRLHRHLLSAPGRPRHADRRNGRRDRRPRAERQDPLFRAVEFSRLANCRGRQRVRCAGRRKPVVCQPYYNLLNRQPEVEILPACDYYGLGVAPYSPIARGVLSGKYRPGVVPEDSRVARRDQRMMETETARNRSRSRKSSRTTPARRNAH